MSERKNINKLFQEKFENFEVTPDEMVWKNIENKLQQKKKEELFRFGGNYQVLLLLYLSG